MSEDYQEIDDQAGICQAILSAHLNREDHKGKLLDGCLFCENFLKLPEGKPFTSWKFITFDVTDDKTNINNEKA